MKCGSVMWWKKKWKSFQHFPPIFIEICMKELVVIQSPLFSIIYINVYTYYKYEMFFLSYSFYGKSQTTKRMNFGFSVIVFFLRIILILILLLSRFLFAFIPSSFGYSAFLYIHLQYISMYFQYFGSLVFKLLSFFQ